MSILRRVGTSVLLATLTLIVLLGARPVSRPTIFAGYLLVLAAIALAAMTAAMSEARASAPSRFDAELLRERIPPSRPADLVRIERELVLGCSDAGHFERRLKPMLQEIAELKGAALIDATQPSLRDVRAIIDELERA